MMNEKLKEICDKYNEAYCYLFGEGGLMQNTLSDDNAKARATATIIIQFDRAGGFYKQSPSNAPAPASKPSAVADDGERCPGCGGVVKKGVNKLGKPYKKCDTCRAWIDAFGGMMPMKG